MQLLEKINNIDEDYSEISEDESSFQTDSEQCATDDFTSESDKEEDVMISKRRGKKRIRLLLSSESEDEVKDQGMRTAPDGTVWEEMDEITRNSKAAVHNIFRELSGPTGYAKRHVMKGNVRSAFTLIIDRRIMEQIRACTEAEAFRVLGTKWELSTEKLNAFIAVLYARGAYQVNNIDVSLLWNKIWGPKFFPKTMSRNVFTEIMRFVRFDKKTDRSERLKSNKFALISDVWDRFIENSQNCYKPGAYITVDFKG